MLKKQITLSILLTGLLVLTVILTACPTEAPSGESGGTLTLTDIPSEYNGQYAVFSAAVIDDDNSEIMFVGAQNVSRNNCIVTKTAARISNGSVNLPMWTITQDGSITRYSGNDTVAGNVLILNSATIFQNQLYEPLALRNFNSITFSNGGASKTWDQGTDDPGTKIGEITGSITLTDIPSPAPMVYIYVYSNYGNWQGIRSQINLNSVTGTSATLDWSIPLYSNNDSFDPSDGYFGLYVQPSGSGSNSFEIEIPVTPYISSPDADVGSLGSVSLRYVTISGTINATINGQPVPYVEISAYSKYLGRLGSTELTSPGANDAWSIYLPVLDTQTEVYFRVSGYQSRYGQQIFDKEIYITPPVYVQGQNLTNITLNVGNMTTITLSGTLNVTYGGQPVSRVVIEVRSVEDDSVLSYISLASPGLNAPWSITLPAFDSPTPVYFNVYGYSSNWDYLFEKTIQPDPPGTVYNQDISNISLNPGDIANPNTPNNPKLLTANTWADGNITTSDGIQWFEFTATTKDQYIHVNFDTLTDLYVQVFNSSYNMVEPQTNLYNSYTFISQTLTVGQKYYIKVWPYVSNDRGTYQIAFNTSSTPPGGGSGGGTFILTGIPSTYNGKYALFSAQDNNNGTTLIGAQSISTTSNSGTAVQISNGSVKLPMWRMPQNGSISRYSGNDTVAGNVFIINTANTANVQNVASPLDQRPFSSITFSNGSAAKTWSQNTDNTYTVYFDLNGGSGTTPSPQTVSYGSTITLPSGSDISNGDSTFGGWTDGYGYETYSAGSDYSVYETTTLYAKWISNALGGEGNPIPLTADTWTNGSITNSTPNGEVWYSFRVTRENTYYVWWNDKYEGDGSKSLDVNVTGYNTNESPGFSSTDSGWSYPQSITAISTGTVKLMVKPYQKSDTGTFAIVYSTSDTRP